MAKKKEFPRNRGGFVGGLPGFAPIASNVEEYPNVPATRSKVMWIGYRSILLYSFDRWRFRTVPYEGGRSSWQELPPGSAVLVQTGFRYQVDTALAKRGSRHLWVVMDGIENSPLAVVAERPGGYMTFRDPDGRLAWGMLEMVDVIEQRPPEMFWRIQMKMQFLVTVLMASRQEADGGRVIDASTDPRRSDRLVQQAIDYIVSNVSRPIRLKDLARTLNASVSTVAHRYRASAGESPMQTARRLRIAQARAMLLQGRRTADIADDLGFCDERYFSSAFKRETGLSPRAFLDAVKTEAGPAR